MKVVDGFYGDVRSGYYIKEGLKWQDFLQDSLIQANDGAFVGTSIAADRLTKGLLLLGLAGFPTEPWNLENLAIWILFVQVQKWSGICPKTWENLDRTRNLAKNLDKTWNVKIYKISILYWNNFSHVLYSSEFWTSLVSAFWCQNCPHYNLENDLFDLDKTWR